MITENLFSCSVKSELVVDDICPVCHNCSPVLGVTDFDGKECPVFICDRCDCEPWARLEYCRTLHSVH